jgi:imidazoleglycerol-phosphate dehydratase
MRKGQSKRHTKETDILVELDLDGSGQSSITTGIPFFDHMLELFSRHGLIDLTIRAKGDIEVDHHHTVEDTGIVLGLAFAEALGDKKGIRRFGNATAPMDESLSTVSVDISGRAYLVFDAKVPKIKTGDFDAEVVKEFFQAFAFNAKVSLHIRNAYGDNTHHVFESVFKAFGLALREATALDPRVTGVPSTKGSL